MQPRLISIVAVCLAVGAAVTMAAGEVVVEGLFPGAAVLEIDGERKLLRVGQSWGGVTLVASASTSATLEIDGERRVVGLSRAIGSNYRQPEALVVQIARDGQMQYRTNALINGRSALVLVDTGANIVALSTEHADALGVDYSDGQLSQVRTASGVVDSRLVTLRSVSVGGIRVDNVEASVIEGGFPETILLGMTYLRHVNISEQNGVLSLSRVR